MFTPPWRQSWALLGAVWLVALPAHAQSTARLVYVRAAGAQTCPNEDAVRTAVAVRLGHDPIVPSAPITVLVEVTGEGSRFFADVKIIGADGLQRGARRLQTSGGRCDELVEALALTMSIAIEPLGSAAPSAAPQPPPKAPAGIPTERADPTELPDGPPSPPPALPTPSPRLRPFAGLGVLGALGAEPALSAGGDIFLGVAQGWASIELDGRGDLPVSASSPIGVVRGSRIMGSLVPCAHVGLPFVCAVGSVASIQAAGQGGGARTGSAITGDAGARLGIEVAAGAHLAFRAYADLLVAIAPPKLQLDGTDAFTYPPITADLGVAGLVHF